ncbi:hypothetical protein MATL_G00096240 [Megalops atlanticus]|uniref:Uncharacterized protein n=1 Tax=Megalops atlanticus TaxID=7932 RepID=A0A9D3Q0Y7_MEGAT|nr:hypothetical protein MATL_G00096240 [Megalops atlanticus]
MARELKSEEMKNIICRLKATNSINDLTVATLDRGRRDIGKALETQYYLNKTIKYLHTGIAPEDDRATVQQVKGAATRNSSDSKWDS